MGFLKNNPMQSSRAYPILSDVSGFPGSKIGDTFDSCNIGHGPLKRCGSSGVHPLALDRGNVFRQSRESSARVPSVSDDDAQNWRCRWSRVAEIWGADQKVVASRLCALRASTSAVRQTDRLRGAAHPVVNIRTSEHHIPSRPRLSVRMFGSWGKKRANASSNCAAL